MALRVHGVVLLGALDLLWPPLDLSGDSGTPWTLRTNCAILVGAKPLPSQGGHGITEARGTALQVIVGVSDAGGEATPPWILPGQS